MPRHGGSSPLPPYRPLPLRRSRPTQALRQLTETQSVRAIPAPGRAALVHLSLSCHPPTHLVPSPSICSLPHLLPPPILSPLPSEPKSAPDGALFFLPFLFHRLAPVFSSTDFSLQLPFVPNRPRDTQRPPTGCSWSQLIAPVATASTATDARTHRQPCSAFLHRWHTRASSPRRRSPRCPSPLGLPFAALC